MSASEAYSFTSTASRTLVANFVAGAPQLDIELAGGNVVISWPANEVYTLQRNPGLDPLGWSDVTTGIVTFGGRKQYTAVSPVGTGFFRLIRH